LLDISFCVKNLISSILGISLNKYLTKEEVTDKIENCNLSDLERVQLQEAYDKIQLKLEIAEKKKKVYEQNNYIEELKKNSKTKIIKDLEVDYFSKCERQRGLLRSLKKLEESYEFYDKELKKVNEIVEELKKNKNSLIGSTDINGKTSRTMDTKGNCFRYYHKY